MSKYFAIATLHLVLRASPSLCVCVFEGKIMTGGNKKA